MDAVLPVPLAVDRHLAAGPLLGPRRGERHVVVGLGASPHERRAESVSVRLVRSKALAVLGLRLAAHAPVGPGPEANPAVAGSVAEERRREADDAVAPPVERLDGGYARAVLLGPEGARADRFGSSSTMRILFASESAMSAPLFMNQPRTSRTSG